MGPIAHETNAYKLYEHMCNNFLCGPVEMKMKVRDQALKSIKIYSGKYKINERRSD